MSIPVQVEGTGGNRAIIGAEGDMVVSFINHPYIPQTSESYPFSSYFLNGSDNDMRKDGSTNAVEFSITARTDRDIFIRSISIIIADAGAELNTFGNLASLTNGVDFIFISSAVGEIMVFGGIKRNLDLIRLGNETGAVGGGTDSWKSDIFGAGADAYLPRIDVGTIFGYPYGVHLRKSSLDRLTFRINDNLSTGLDQFDAIGFGIQK